MVPNPMNPFALASPPVTTLQSTCHAELDAEAIKGLMRWKARPSQKREVDIPVTFVAAKGNL